MSRHRRRPDVIPLIDTHAHLDDEQFAADRPAVLERARAANVGPVVAVATTAASSAGTLALATAHASLFATVGIHPNNAARALTDDWDAVVALAGDARVVGIGETGLDRHWDDTPFPVQEEYFARHLELGRQTGKPVVIHCREAEADVLRMLRAAFDRQGPIRGVMHSFTGNRDLAEACRAMGLYLSFAGMLTYKNAADLRETAAVQPLDRLLVETDSPYLAPVPVRGKRNEPANVVHTAACLAGLLGVSAETLAEQTTTNARALFGLPG
jgi:TatD DNase family protein